ncbi:MAG TPA: GTPase [Candidatus Eremiobacteraceae bacterium]|nr:GTPase [Candidatus Eremiobacteraceae bacterium]
MAAGLRALLSVADLIDLVIEVRDARMPSSTAVAAAHPRLRAKPSIVLLNRSDLAEAALTARWEATLRSAGVTAHATIGTRAASLAPVRADLAARPRKRALLRAAVVGAPNSGKSSVINALGRTKRAVAQDKPGVTRHVRWLRAAPDVELLDTPGLLPPRIESEDAAWQLAACGTLPESAFDAEDAAEHLHRWLLANRPRLARDVDVESFALAHGMRVRGGELDRANAARKLLSLFRGGKLFRITFERPKDGA